ncbi:hypothetical protein ACWDA9_40605, partial [Streptomyces sp. NPDC001193]
DRLPYRGQQGGRVRARRDQHVLGVRAARVTDGVAAALLLLLRTELLDQPGEAAGVADPGQRPPGDFPDRAVEVRVARVVESSSGNSAVRSPHLRRRPAARVRGSGGR